VRNAAPRPAPRQNPVERFLGAVPGAGGPFALLGLTPESCSEDLVLTALDRQIDLISQHPECDTPEADEVRLALHAAAAQLLDPVVRRHLIARWTGKRLAPDPAPRGGGVQAGPAGAVRLPLQAERMLEADAILTLAMCGGWNSRSLRRLITIAHSRGLTNAHVVLTLSNLSARWGRAGVAAGGGATASPAGPRAAGRIDAPYEAWRLPPEPAPVVAAALPRGEARAPYLGPASSVPVRPRVAPAPPEPEQIAVQDPGQELLRRAVMFGGVGLVIVVGVLVMLVAISRKGVGPAPAPPGPSAKAGVGAGAVPATPDAAAPPATPVRAAEPERASRIPARPRPRPPADPADIGGIPAELAACAEGVAISGDDAAERFESAIARLAANWTALPRDRLIACQDSIVEYLYRSAGVLEINLRAVAAIAQGARALGTGRTAPGAPFGGGPGATLAPEHVLPAAWSAGMLTRLAREKDLSAAAKSAVEHESNAALGVSRPSVDQTFESGVNAALTIIPHRLLGAPSGPGVPPAPGATEPDQDAWQAFAKGCEALAGNDAPQRQRLILAGLEVLLIDGPEPNQSRGAAAVIADLISSLTWRAGEPSRAWLLRWFGDRRITPADLHAITSALATRSSAEGVDITMVLSTSAADNTRADLRERYATVWGMQESVSRDELAAAWARAAREQIERSYMTRGQIEDAASATVLARLNESAFLQWRGDGGAAAGIVSDLRRPVDALIPDTAAVALRPRENVDLGDGAWAERYLAARQNTKQRRELLEQLGNAGIGATIGATDAEVLAGEALLGSPTDLRNLAQQVARGYSSSPAMVNAVLERLPRLSRVQQQASFVEYFAATPLPGVKDPEWPLRARRALIERLLELVAAEGTVSPVDRIARELRVSYCAMAGAAALSGDERSEPIQPSAGDSAASLYRTLRASADTLVPTVAAPYTLEQIDRRRAGRIGQARGLVQAFAAEEVSIAEVMAYLATVEQPARAADVRLVTTQLVAERRRAEHVLGQIKATERAIVQLWLIRMNQGLSAEEGAS
jgi:hypothetical protein